MQPQAKNVIREHRGPIVEIPPAGNKIQGEGGISHTPGHLTHTDCHTKLKRRESGLLSQFSRVVLESRGRKGNNAEARGLGRESAEALPCLKVTYDP